MKEHNRLHRCDTKVGQETINEFQLDLIQGFLEEGNKSVRLRAYVIQKSQTNPDVWNQMLIFLALARMTPKGLSFSPSSAIDEVWHQLILCTREYCALCRDVGVGIIHHVPDGLSEGEPLPQWLSGDGVEKFLDGKIPEFVPDFWREKETVQRSADYGSESGEFPTGPREQGIVCGNSRDD
jgi:hypothetical protein